ncbi:MAG: TlpA family protein disulfide reductase [FCB group bacterium]|nr:TlpA family protein disulfide reductase [FCB group bacterium]
MKRIGLAFVLIWLSTFAMAQKTEVAVPDTNGSEGVVLKPGDLAPSWALMYAPGKFEFLKNWTVERGKRLRRFKTQPVRHVVVLSFFATWCKPCMKELPYLQNLYEKYQGKNVKFFLVDITEATRNNPGYENSPVAGPFLRSKGVMIPILNDNRGVAKERYGAKTLPRLFIIDKYQTIRMTKQGFHEGEDFEGELSAMIDKLLAEE